MFFFLVKARAFSLNFQLCQIGKGGINGFGPAVADIAVEVGAAMGTEAFANFFAQRLKGDHKNDLLSEKASKSPPPAIIVRSRSAGLNSSSSGDAATGPGIRRSKSAATGWVNDSGGGCG
jgi:hypothetical protein